MKMMDSWDLEAIEFFTKEAKSNAVKSAPKYGFEEIYLEKSLNKLRKLAKLHNVKNYTKMNKEELVCGIKEQLLSFERLRELMFMYKKDLLDKFIELSLVPSIEISPYDYYDNILSIKLGVAELYFFEDKFIVVIPTEIREMIKGAYSKEFIDTKSRYDLITDYAIACANLYGVISFDEFIDIFNDQNIKDIDNDELYNVLFFNIEYGDAYTFYDEYIINDVLGDDDFEDVEDILSVTKGKPRYIPKKSELLKYADDEYYEKTQYTNDLKNYLTDKCDDEETMLSLVDEIAFLAGMDADLDEITEVLETQEIIPTDLNELNVFINIAANLKNNSRIWANKGYTPNEMMHKLGRFNAPNMNSGRLAFPQMPSMPSVSAIPPANFNPVTKTGRNDPCPCGSGKKYKKCCGR